ncbi:virulence protein [Legionella quinlivanii]|uniref:Virulence protein n=1 Tax=Legionella quinlivanii TaxID=45073 RepID=A0A0W0Y598_9GAMM|nr:hypothetical protein [Legionella quinlivanii]KTD52161.1 virulence protein [Legionella quinlivanii]MCW8452425.1 virulence factor [Legionella quinlivanii]SEF77012.1 hypothetical protein SAMN02746093_01048 [Legionella quinlivanii DSM 21216]STY12340.1 virulence protein [Legionella quinlivanii]
MAEANNSDGFLIGDDIRQEIKNAQDMDPIALVEQVYQLWWHWANFELYIISPIIDPVIPPLVIEPELLPNSQEREFVYNIHDFGHKMTTSKAEDMYEAGMSMCKLYYTIEKMIFLLIERLKSGGIDQETEVQIAFGGHELGQRKAFESVINLSYNVVVTNFDPGAWGERYLQNVKVLASKGYGYPEGTPRDVYRKHPQAGTPGMKR